MSNKIEFDEEKLEDLITLKGIAKDYEDFKKSFEVYRIGSETRQRETENECVILKQENEASKKKIAELEKLLLSIAKAGWRITGYIVTGIGGAIYFGVKAFNWFVDSTNRDIFNKFFRTFD